MSESVILNEPNRKATTSTPPMMNRSFRRFSAAIRSGVRGSGGGPSGFAGGSGALAAEMASGGGLLAGSLVFVTVSPLCSAGFSAVTFHVHKCIEKRAREEQQLRQTMLDAPQRQVKTHH